MRKIISLLIAIQIFGWCNAQKMPRAYFEVAQFMTADNKPYVETYLNLLGNSLKWNPDGTGFKSKVELEYQFFKDTTMVNVSKISLSSPFISDSTKKINFLDAQRFPIATGNYKLIITIKDVYGNSKKSTIVYNLDIKSNDTLPITSDIEFVEASSVSTNKNSPYFKSGLEIIPYVSTFFEAQQKDFIFYVELYHLVNYLKNLQLPPKALVTYGIYKDGLVLDGFMKQQRIDPQTINVILGKFNTADLGTGKYELIVKIFDASGKAFIEKSKYFERINSTSPMKITKDTAINGLFFPYNITRMDSLKEMILSLHPITTEMEMNSGIAVLKDNDMKMIQNYLYNYWKSKSEKDPEMAYFKYAEQVYHAQQLFGGKKIKGYKTDRGRVFLQYGLPDSRQPVVNDANNYPYEIWQYYRIPDVGGKSQSNRMFVFADFQMTSLEYKLIHSTARGEVNDPRWQIRLQKRMLNSVNLDNEKSVEGQGNNADEFFNAPR